MRPTKLSATVLEAFERILNHRHNIIVCTDQQLFFLLNAELPREGRISYRSFQRYKMLANTYGATEDHFTTEDDPEKNEYYPSIYGQLYSLFTQALIRQKNNLMDKILENPVGWQRYKWIMERKFRDWNLQEMQREIRMEEEEIAESENLFDDVSDYGIVLAELPLDNDAFPPERAYPPVPYTDPADEMWGSEEIPPRPSNTAWLDRRFYVIQDPLGIMTRYKWIEPEEQECHFHTRLREEPPPLPDGDAREELE